MAGTHTVFHLGTQGRRETGSLFAANNTAVFILMSSYRHTEEHLICWSFLKAVNPSNPAHLLIFLRLFLINAKL